MKLAVLSALGVSAFAAAMLATATPASAQDSWLSGTVVNVSLGTKVAGVKVRAFMVGADKMQDSSVTDSNGEFTLVHLRPGTFRLAFDATGYHESIIADVRVKASDEHIHLSAPVALYPMTMNIPLEAALMDPCRDIVQPGQTADVYIICSSR